MKRTDKFNKRNIRTITIAATEALVRDYFLVQSTGEAVKQFNFGAHNNHR
jgi:hypothetical protein